ncbi:MAG: hypothetical protein P4L77_03950 [Sulfuriferula sp.]|nr:hypothetical protein [Sulfuriferula sp.]
MPDLVESKQFIDLAIAKPTGLNDLGVPLLESTVVKKGKLHELTQPLSDGKAGRMFQNLRVTAVKTTEGSTESAKIFATLEVFGDGNVPEAANRGFGIRLYAGTENLMELVPGDMFLPYANFWYDNRFAFDIPNEVFDQTDRLEFIAMPDQVRAI